MGYSLRWVIFSGRSSTCSDTIHSEKTVVRHAGGLAGSASVVQLYSSSFHSHRIAVWAAVTVTQRLFNTADWPTFQRGPQLPSDPNFDVLTR